MIYVHLQHTSGLVRQRFRRPVGLNMICTSLNFCGVGDWEQWPSPAFGRLSEKFCRCNLYPPPLYGKPEIRQCTEGTEPRGRVNLLCHIYTSSCPTSPLSDLRVDVTYLLQSRLQKCVPAGTVWLRSPFSRISEWGWVFLLELDKWSPKIAKR